MVVLGCVEEEPEYRLDDIECALRYNSLDSGIPPEYDEDEVANSINTTLNRSVYCIYIYNIQTTIFGVYFTIPGGIVIGEYPLKMLRGGGLQLCFIPYRIFLRT